MNQRRFFPGNLSANVLTNLNAGKWYVAISTLDMSSGIPDELMMNHFIISLLRECLTCCCQWSRLSARKDTEHERSVHDAFCDVTVRLPATNVPPAGHFCDVSRSLRIADMRRSH